MTLDVKINNAEGSQKLDGSFNDAFNPSAPNSSDDGKTEQIKGDDFEKITNRALG